MFTVRVRFHEPLDEKAYDDLIDGFIDMIEALGLAMAGFGGTLPISETKVIVCAWGRGSPSEEDRQAVVSWLAAQPEVAAAEADEFVDAWYGYDK